MAHYPVEVAYCTDVEGNLSYFERWVETAARVLRFDSTGKELELVHEGAYFVYGGDVCDNGPGDLRLCQLLVSLKRRHPDRVALLSGNRDLNKLRMTAELEQAPPPSPDPNHSRVTMVAGSPSPSSSPSRSPAPSPAPSPSPSTSP